MNTGNPTHRNDMPFPDTISVVSINYRTPLLLDECVRSFTDFYPDIPFLIVDNGSQDDSLETIRKLEQDLPGVSSVLFEENRYHGPAMDAALRRLESDYVFFLDSDTVTKQGGFLEEMAALCAPPTCYGVGKIVHINRRGFAVLSGLPALASAYMLIDRKLYLTLPPFVHHGFPGLQNFRAAREAGFRLAEYPINEYIHHLGRGTAALYGYGLGLRSRLDFVLHKLGF